MSLVPTVRDGQYIEQVQPEHEEDRGDCVVCPWPEIAQHTAGGSRDCSDERDRPENAEREQRRETGRAARCHHTSALEKPDD